MNRETCNVTGCNNLIDCKGLCKKHYDKYRREFGMGKMCSECHSPATSKGYCDKCYLKVKRRNTIVTCARCPKPVFKKRLCSIHYKEYKTMIGKIYEVFINEKLKL